MTSVDEFGRFPGIPPADMPPDQKDAYLRLVEGPRQRVPAPYRVWLSNPDLVRSLEPLGLHFKASSLTPRETEIVILVTAAHIGSPYVLEVHGRFAAEAGIDAATIAALCRGETPAFADARETLVCVLAAALLRAPSISQSLHDRAVALIDHPAIADVTVLVGYYVAVAGVLKFYQVAAPAMA